MKDNLLLIAILAAFVLPVVAICYLIVDQVNYNAAHLIHP